MYTNCHIQDKKVKVRKSMRDSCEPYGHDLESLISS